MTMISSSCWRAIGSVLVVALSLAGCAQDSWLIAKGDAFQDVGGGALVVNQALVFPPETTRLFVQDGQVVNRHHYDHYSAVCVLEKDALLSRPQTLPAGRYRITAVTTMRTEVIRAPHPAEPVVVASAAPDAFLLAQVVDSGGAQIHRGFIFELAADHDPGLSKLSCFGSYLDPQFSERPTTEEMEWALGALATLQLAPN